MPRKAFVADLHEAAAACSLGEIDLHDLQPGGDDGDFKFQYGVPGQNNQYLQIEAHVSGEFTKLDILTQHLQR